MSELIEHFWGENLGSTYILTGSNLCISLLFTLVVSGFLMVIYRIV